MHSNTIKFINEPENIIKFRSDLPGLFKGKDKKIMSIKVNSSIAHRYKIVVKLFLKEPENTIHFHHLCNTINNCQVMELEQEVKRNQNIIKLDFFKIKKARKNEALEYLRDIPIENSFDIYKKNLFNIIIQISLVDVETLVIYDVIKHELTLKNKQISIKYYSPSILSLDDDELLVTVVLDNSEKDVESISLELNIHNFKCIEVKNLKKPTSLKNIFCFSLKNVVFPTNNFSGRLRRTGSPTVYSKWMEFIIMDLKIEKGKRKINIIEDHSTNKILRLISSPISENLTSEFNSENLSNSSISSLCSNQRSAQRQNLIDLLEKKVLSSIARAGNDFAFGVNVTDFMNEVFDTLPAVFLLQDDVGDTPLHNAILQNQEERAEKILQILYKNFPNEIHIKNSSNQTALILAPACKVSPNFVQKLIFYGFNLNDKDINGNSAFTIAVEYKNDEVLEVLVQNAIAHRIFHNNISEILSLLKKTIIEFYFEGYKILMNSSLACDLRLDSLAALDLSLDSDSTYTYEEFKKQLLSDVTSLPESIITYNQNLMDEDFKDAADEKILNSDSISAFI